MTTMQRARALGFGACALAGGLWGCSFLVGKIALVEMGFAHMILFRFLFATAALVPLLIRHRPQLNSRDWMLLTVASFFGVPMQFLIQFYGLSLTTASHASLMVGTMPVLLAIGAALFLHECLDVVGWTAVAVSTCGAALIALSGNRHAAHGGASLPGDLLIVVSMVMALVWILINKALMQRHSAVVITIYGIVQGTVMLMVWVPCRYGMPPFTGNSIKVWLAIAGSGLLCTAAPKFLWNWGITRVPASQAGVLLNMQPLVGCLLGILILRERLGLSAWGGGGMILAATLILVKRSKSKVTDRAPEARGVILHPTH